MNDHYQLLTEHSTDMISRHTPVGIFLYASPASRMLLGYDPDKLIGRIFYEFFHPQDINVGEVSDLHSN